MVSYQERWNEYRCYWLQAQYYSEQDRNCIENRSYQKSYHYHWQWIVNLTMIKIETLHKTRRISFFEANAWFATSSLNIFYSIMRFITTIVVCTQYYFARIFWASKETLKNNILDLISIFTIIIIKHEVYLVPKKTIKTSLFLY